ncbi:MAG: GGDEF domain-containing protein [Acidaminococcaceae bacterium]|nr:GGDEF domain-containing protein [Acidaminococcaceae bacterium]
MFNWLSDYNYDFALAAVPIQLILLIYYCSRRNLPIRSSFSFFWVMVANLVMTVFDIVSCEMNEVWTEYPLWVMYGVNQLYFCAFIARGWALFDYTAEECHGYAALGKWLAKFSAVPALLTAILVLSTPWTGAIFLFSPERGYFNTGLYNSIYVCMYFYIALSLLCVFLQWNRIDVRLKTSMLEYNVILIAGMLLRKMFMGNLLVTSYFSILAILIIYLSAQNPDLYRDRKTHLFNKDAFNRIGAECLIKGIPFHCIVADVDNYESVKMLYGYQQMKRSMEQFGRWLIQSFPHYYVFYFRNGEFLMLQKNHRFEDQKDQILQMIRDSFSQPWAAEETDVHLRISALVLPYDMLPTKMTKAHDFIVHSFQHAYVENHRDNYVVTREICDAFDREGNVEKALGRALGEQRVEAWFQPIYSVQQNRIVGAEALARLRDPKLGFIPPDEFIRVAERTGDIMEVGRQVFERVCELLETGEPGRLGVRKINVNLSPVQCMNDRLAAELSAIAEKHGVSLDRINFEITESSLSDYRLIQKQMQLLQEKGSTFSLDDFGTGTSNLTRLVNLPIHAVKMDLVMVRNFFEGRLPILPDIVNMFRKTKMQIVAEGVETKEMKETLASLGCDYEQGYYFAKPLPPEDFVSYLKKEKGEIS